MCSRLLVLILALAPLASISAQVAVPDTPAGRVFTAWLEAFNSGDRALIDAYVKKHGAPNDTVDSVLGFRNQTGGFELLSIENSAPLWIEYGVKERGRETRAFGRMVVSTADPPRVTSSMVRAVPPGVTATPSFSIDAATRKRVIDAAIAKLREVYVLEDKAEAMVQMLTRRRDAGEYDAIVSGGELAQLLTDQLRAVSHDLHLNVNFSPVPMPPPPAQPAPQGPPPPAVLERMRQQMAQINCGFQKVEILQGNVGYLKFNMFANPEVCGATATTAMAFLENVSALIVDMRDNGGGDPAMVAYVQTYLFAERTHLNDLWTRSTGKTQEWWTNPDLPGKRLATQPLYVLTSSRTFSGGEEFTYNLQSLKRATIVGETTGGGAHPVSGQRLDDRFMMGVPFARAINPVTKTNWEGTGVVPDVKVPAAEALEKAQELLRTNTRPPGPRAGG
jgi:retinol-binding protein 3